MNEFKQIRKEFTIFAVLVITFLTIAPIVLTLLVNASCIEYIK